MIIGIDIGGSSTKIVGLCEGKIYGFLTIRASEPVASASGALGGFLDSCKLSVKDIENIIITGVGASFIKSGIIGIPVSRVDEFRAIGLGGLYLSRRDEAVVVSIGTGTAIIKAEGENITHLGGTGVGGGTLFGLAKCLISSNDLNNILEMADSGKLENIDLYVSDISKNRVGNLPFDTTASNFGKISEKATKNDFALGIINLVFETIGTVASFASKLNNNSCIVITGALASIPIAKKILKKVSGIFGVPFLIPHNASYATAVGAALSVRSKKIQGESL